MAVFNGGAMKLADDRAAAARNAREAPWTSDDVERALLEAYRVDRRMPGIGGPKKPGGSHPAVYYSRAEIAELQRMVDAGEATIGPARVTPTRSEIKRMGLTFLWLEKVQWRDADEHHRMALIDWMRTESAGLNHKTLCAERGLMRPTYYYRVGKALALIARRLNARCVDRVTFEARAQKIVALRDSNRLQPLGCYDNG
jgi:hypothetical protein